MNVFVLFIKTRFLFLEFLNFLKNRPDHFIIFSDLGSGQLDLIREILLDKKPSTNFGPPSTKNS